MKLLSWAVAKKDAHAMTRLVYFRLYNISDSSK